MNILLIIFQACLVVYVLILVWFLVGLFRADPARSDERPRVSVLVAIRGGHYLARLLEQLRAQDYPAEQLEFVIVDDGMFPSARALVEKAASADQRVKVVESADGDDRLTHKKRALDAGIQHSGGDILLFTDADCQVGPGWVSTMVSYFTPTVDYVVGWSQIAPGSGWSLGDEMPAIERPLHVFEQLDFVMLMLAARGATLMGTPWASTGQNQAYRRQVYERAGGFEALAHRLQGDDSLFLQVARKRAKVRVTFATSPESQVVTDPTTSLEQFIFQRIRWASDAVAMWRYTPGFIPVPLATFGANALIPVLIIAAMVHSTTVLPVLIPGILLKAVVEGVLLFVGVGKANLGELRRHFPLWFLLQIPYVTLIGAASFLGNRLPWRPSADSIVQDR
ncbi:MAG: glycosyltransferase [Fidelibacterota bacterium]|nr:MAG: glycosyltransferase [Candidatus Neomarinimicrobiota bacterium]